MSKAKAKAPQPSEKSPTKIDIVIGLLKRPEGADVNQLAQATSWQPHSVRGAIAGTLKKKLGLAVQAEKVDGHTVYRIGA